jgi:flagellar basal-body rod modification protein FlgD
MTVSGVSGADSALAQYMARSKTPENNTQLDSDAFLKLLVAQLKYQDPSKPTDSNEMMAQSAQFTMVQRLEDMAKATASTLGIEQGMAASSLVGKSISWLDTDGSTRTGTVSSASFGGASASEPVLKVATGTGTATGPATSPATSTVQLSQVTAVNAAVSSAG